MGWWATDILGGDTPLDYVCAIEDILGVEDLYPYSRLAGRAGDLRARLDGGGLEQIFTSLISRVGDGWDRSVATQVTAGLVMAVGAQLPEPYKAAAVVAGQRDEWAAEDSERKASIDAYLAALAEYAPPAPTVLTTTGLFEKIAQHLGG